ncbi:MAG: starch synthase, partial [Firmicutes bacterium HGW-Firmicutes-3]
MADKLNVLYVSPEIVPYAATGGLADVAEALPYALMAQNVETTRVMPKFKGIS